MYEPRIILAGLGPKLEGLKWESSSTLRIGRQHTADVVLRDSSVERLHAELKYSGYKWVVRDLAGSVRYPTMVNGVALTGGHREVREHDVLQFGKLLVKVATLIVTPADNLPVTPPSHRATRVLPHSSASWEMRRNLPGIEEILAANGRPDLGPQFQAILQNSWDQAFESIAGDGRHRQGSALLTLLRANHHLSAFSHLDELLQSILADAQAALQAQRAAILLLDPLTDQLVLRATLTPGLSQANESFSKGLVERCFQHGQSFLCRDTDAQPGSTSSLICALLRTPRRRLGVLCLGRGPLHKPFNETELSLADAIAASVAIGIECAQLVEQQREQLVETVTAVARAVEMRDRHAGDHTKRVTQYALLLADELRLPHLDRDQLRIGTPLHDIGKISIDEAILRKPGKLTPAEFEAMKDHTLKGAALIGSIGSLNPVVPIIRHHHERWDGTGYPDKLGRDQIAVTARIVAVADAFDAMTSPRPYRPAMPAQLAFLELLSRAGTHFDPACVQAFFRLRPKVEGVLNQT